MIRRTAVAVALTLGLGSLTGAEVLELRDGRRVEAAYVGEDEGWVLVLLPSGREAQFPRAAVERIDWTHQVDDRLRRKAERAREKLTRRQQREVERLLRRYGRAGADERAACAAQLGRYTADVLIEPLAEALDDGHEPTRELAVARLAALDSPKAVGPLVRAALTSEHAELRQQAHAAAIAVDRGLARRFYETVAATPTKPVRRLRALQRLRALGDVDAVPGLVRVLEQVRSELRTTLATSKGGRNVPLDLGSRRAAGRRVPLDLPEATLTQIQTGAVATVATLRRLQAETLASLEAVSDQDLGDDPAAWRRWWERRPPPRKPPTTSD